MRINKLDLLRYGRFTNVSLEFPKAVSDVHIIFGPNEAGKSTSLAAIEDLLFGIPHNSPYNFVHDYANMRVGGVLEHDGKLLEVRRRKGHKDTLLAPNESPLPSGDSAIIPFLGGADQTFFARMFSLNHERLAKGGREILEAKDEVGQTLFSAGAGLSGLRERMVSLSKEADDQWGPRRAGRRKYYNAVDALEEADKAQREHTLTASKWQETKRTLDSAQEAYTQLETQIETHAAEERKLSRIRRVYRQIRRLAEVNEEINGLGEVTALPDDADTQLDTATQAQSDAHSKIEELDGQRARASAERSDLKCDEALLMRSDDIEQLHKQRIEVQKEKVDLPKRRAELAAKEERLRDLVEDLGWESGEPADQIARIPPRAKVTAVRSLLTGRGELAAATKSAQTTVDEAGNQVQELQDELNAAEAGLDVSTLAAVIKATREVTDVASRIKAAEKEVRDSESGIEKRLKPLRPQVASAQVLAEVSVPPRSAVQDYRDTLRDLEQQAKLCRERIVTTDGEIAQHRKAYNRIARDTEVVAPEELERARGDRDTGWALIRKRYIDSADAPEKEIAAFVGSASDLPAAFETKVETADAMADRRFDMAQAAGEIAVIVRQIDEREEALTTLRNEEGVLTEKKGDFAKKWCELWCETPFEPLAPDFMLDWLDARTVILGLIESRNAAASQITALQEEESAARAAITAELAALGDETKGLGEQPLKVVLEAASNVQQRHEKRAESKKVIEDRIRKLQADTGRKQARLEKAQGAWTEWLSQWSAALESLAVSRDAAPEIVAEQLDAIDEMRSVANNINQLQRDRIAKIERDIESFANSVMGLAGAVAGDLVKREPEDAVLQMEKRLEEAKRVRDQQNDKDKAITALEKRIKECEEAGQSAQQALETLRKMAGVEQVTQLKDAIRISRHRREVDAERTNLEKALIAEGDGLPLPELREECAAVDLDQIAAREETLQNELKDSRSRLTLATEQRAQARQAFDAFGGDGRAAQAAAARQEALASMRDAAEKYVRVRTAATLLQWAIGRYRREKQAPLLNRAGKMFATLTLDSFTDLRVEYDDQDRARLAGIRPDQSSVGIGGMSDGTADQLYLALRLASVDEYLSRAHPIPFVADDLLVNFDDARAAAGFKVLAQLGQKTQILFFTHHQHLVDIARASLGKSINVISLAEDQVASAA